MNGGMRVQQFVTTVENADAVGAQHLVAGERGVVDTESVHVDRLVRHRLAGVEDRQRADRLGALHQLRDGCDGPGDIRMMAEGNDFDIAIQLQRVDVDTAFRADRVPLQRCAGAPGQLLPRHEVGVVFQFGGDDHVAGTDRMLETVVPQCIGDQVDGLGRVLGEHQLIGIGADERRDVGAALLVGVGGLLHQLVCTTMHGTV